MSIGQIVLYGILVLIALLMARRYALGRLIVQYSTADVAKKIRDRRDVVLLDVRTPAERQHRSIKGSMHIPMHELRTRAEELEKHRNKEVICYCASGSRSLSAAALLRKRGFNAANMKGGIAEWNLRDLQ